VNLWTVRLRRSPPDRASAVPLWTSRGKHQLSFATSPCPRGVGGLPTSFTAPHEQQQGYEFDDLREKAEPPAGYRALRLFSRERLFQTTRDPSQTVGEKNVLGSACKLRDRMPSLRDRGKRAAFAFVSSSLVLLPAGAHTSIVRRSEPRVPAFLRPSSPQSVPVWVPNRSCRHGRARTFQRLPVPRGSVDVTHYPDVDNAEYTSTALTAGHINPVRTWSATHASSFSTVPHYAAGQCVSNSRVRRQCSFGP